MSKIQCSHCGNAVPAARGNGVLLFLLGGSAGFFACLVLGVAVSVVAISAIGAIGTNAENTFQQISAELDEDQCSDDPFNTTSDDS